MNLGVGLVDSCLGCGSTGLSGVQCNRGNFVLEHLPGTRWHERALTNISDGDRVITRHIGMFCFATGPPIGVGVPEFAELKEQGDENVKNRV